MSEPKIDCSRAKPHPSRRGVEPDDPMNLHGCEVSGDPNLMLRMIVEEYARVGCSLETLVGMCRDPFYHALHGLWLHFGEDELRCRLTEIVARTGVVRVREEFRQPASKQLVQIALPRDSHEGTSHA